MKFETYINVFGSEYMTDTNPDGECYRDGKVTYSYAQAFASSYEYLVYMLGWFYKVPPENINPVPQRIYPFQERFDYKIPSDGYEGYVQHLKGGDIYTFIVPLD